MLVSKLAVAFAAGCLLLTAPALAQKTDPENTLLMQLKDGTVTIQLRPDLAPNHAERLKTLTRQGFYDGVVFHRVIEGFMAQTGDPTGTGSGGSDLPDLKAEFSNVPYTRGIVGVARTPDPDSANSQFFIMYGDAPSLNGQYSVVGEVVEGMEAVDAIKKGSNSNNGMVDGPDRIVRMTVAADSERPPDVLAKKEADTTEPVGDVSAREQVTGEAAAAAGRRVALVIGNSGYAAVPSLPNAARDAKAVAQMLEHLGFTEVVLREDLDYSEFRRALSDFGDVANGADWAVIYYAGHGVGIDGENYVIPVDARLERDRDVDFEALPLGHILGTVEEAATVGLVILDACRNNPFLAQMQTSSRTRSITRGLARVEPRSGGTLVAYAARDGQVAEDGSGGNSPFVSALLQHMPTPGLELSNLFRLVRQSVIAATDGRQEPVAYDALPPGSFSFSPLPAAD